MSEVVIAADVGDLLSEVERTTDVGRFAERGWEDSGSWEVG